MKEDEWMSGPQRHLGLKLWVAFLLCLKTTYFALLWELKEGVLSHSLSHEAKTLHECIMCLFDLAIVVWVFKEILSLSGQTLPLWEPLHFTTSFWCRQSTYLRVRHITLLHQSAEWVWWCLTLWHSEVEMQLWNLDETKFHVHCAMSLESCMKPSCKSFI